MRLREGWRLRWGIALAAAISVILVLVWTLYLPGKIEERFVSTIERRFGLPAKIGEASAGLFSVSLHEVVIGDDQGVSVEIEEIVVPTSPIRIAFGGASSIDRVEMNQANVRVDLVKPNALKLLERFAKRKAAKTPDDAEANTMSSSVLPELALHQLDVELRDAHGKLLVAHDVAVALEAGDKRLNAKQVVAGEEPGDRLELHDVTVSLSRELRELSVGSGKLRPGSDTSRERIASRVLDVRDQLLSGTSPGPESDSSVVRTSRLSLQDLTVLPAADSDDPVLSDLSVLAERKGTKPWHLQGEGRPRGDGQLSWNLDVDRDTLTVKGNVHFERLPLSVITPFLPTIPWYQPESTQLSGDLKVNEASAAEASFEARLEVRDLGLDSERVASAPVSGISFVVKAEGDWQTDARRLTIRKGAVQVERARAEFAGNAFEREGHWGFDIKATMPPTRCGDAVGAIPTDLLAEVSGFSWQGQLAGSVHAVADSEKLDEAKLRIEVNDGCKFESAPAIAELERYREPFTHRVLEDVDEQGREDWFEMSAGPGSSNWTSIWGMSPFFVHAVLAHEDASFFSHSGFAPWAISGAFRRNLKAGRYVVGASTISMQLTKNLFLHREKTLARKAQEVILTWWLENRWDKRTILEMYLNVIEYGPGIYGITAASEYYFGRDPAELSLAEGAFLATILPNPKKYHASYARGSLSPGVANKMRFLIRHMGRKARIDAVAVEHGLAEVDRFSFQSPDADSAPGPRTFVGAAASLPYMAGGAFASPIATEDMIWENDQNESDPDPSEQDAQMLGW